MTSTAAELTPAEKRAAMEEIIRVCFKAGFEAGASGYYPRSVEPIIEWDGNAPKIAGCEVRP